MKHRVSTWIAASLLLNGVLLSQLQAQSVTTLDPNAFVPGTNVTDAFAGVTLSTFSLTQIGSTSANLPLYAPSYAPVYATLPSNPQPDFAGSVFSSSAPADFGYAPMWGGIGGSCFTQCTAPDRPDGFGTNLLVDFSSPVASVSILDVGNWANGVYMEAFNASNQIVGSCAPTVAVLAVGNYGCFSVLNNSFADAGGYEQETSISAGGGISKILIGGYNNAYSVSTIQ